MKFGIIVQLCKKAVLVVKNLMPKNVFPAKLFSVDLGDAKRAWKMYPLLICLMDLKSETYNLGCPRKLSMP